MSDIRRCRDCTYFSLASEGLNEDMCTFYNKALSRDEVIKSTACQKFEPRREEKDPFFVKYEAELKKYLSLAILFFALGVIILYIITN